MYSKFVRSVRSNFAVLTAVFVLTACGGGGGGGDVTDVGSTVGDVGSVTPGATVGAASVSWSAPVNRADGQPLAPGEIQGYRIYYGTGSGSYAYAINVNDGGATSYTVNDLPVGTYYFVLTTVDSSGRESSYSAEAVRSVTS